MIRADVKRVVRATYAFACGTRQNLFCLNNGVSEAEVGAELTYDHFVPQSKGATDDADNLVYACHACNEFKGDYSNGAARLLHPLRDDLIWHLHKTATGECEAVTASGTIVIACLQLNRAPTPQQRSGRNGDTVAGTAQSDCRPSYRVARPTQTAWRPPVIKLSV